MNTNTIPNSVAIRLIRVNHGVSSISQTLGSWTSKAPPSIVVIGELGQNGKKEAKSDKTAENGQNTRKSVQKPL